MNAATDSTPATNYNDIEFFLEMAKKLSAKEDNQFLSYLIEMAHMEAFVMKEKTQSSQS